MLKRTTRYAFSTNPRKNVGRDRLAKRIALVKAILMDNDGVLTDGGLIYGPEGIEQARFDVKDGLGIKLAQRAGLITGIISGLGSEALRKRAKTLGVELDEYGFFKVKDLTPLSSTKLGIYVCGCCREPMDIPESVTQASGAAAVAAEAVMRS